VTINRCPACGSTSAHLLDWKFSGLGDSVFNYIADFHVCPDCGLVYVRNVTDPGLRRFYVEECNYFEKAHFEQTSPANQKKYAFYMQFLRDRGIDSGSMADVGCGRGGFVNWIAHSGWEQECCGVDVDARSLPGSTQSRANVSFLDGTCLSLPFTEGKLELLTYFHVLEHIRDLSALLTEAAKVLANGGHILIEVPDAENYAGTPIGSAFWFSIREHINHFTAKALAAALEAHGFAVRDVSRQMLETPEFAYPSLMILAQKSAAASSFKVLATADVAGFARMSREALTYQADRISVLAADKKMTIWGCSAEIFSLLPLLDTSEIRICDSSKLKQSTHYKGIPIEDPAVVPVEGMLVIAPYLHRTAIKKAAQQFGWPDDALYLLQ
jgi:2-polyprenyl-3-methyl-5-hydroxy-6-metoxy-1,4-benzoquinol methylase